MPRARRRVGPVPRVLASIVALIVLVLTVVVGVAVVGLRASSAIRAYVGGEGLWSKAEKDATYALASYAVTGAAEDYARFETALVVPLGDHVARIELEKPDMRIDVAARGFLDGRNHRDDIGSMIWVYRRFRHVSYLERAIAIWTEGDVYIGRLREIGRELSAERKAGPLGEPRRLEYLTRIAELNERVTKLEDAFSYTLGEAARWMRSTILTVLASLTGALLVLSIWAATGIAGLVSRSHESIRHALEREEAANRMKSSFLGLVSHEFRTPLTAMQLQIERLRMDELTPRQSDLLSRLLDASRRLADMIDALLQYVRIESGSLKLSLESVDPCGLASETVDEMRLLAQRKGLSLALEASSDLRPLVTDRRLFRFLLTNLIGNAIKFTTSGVIGVRVWASDESHFVSVSDTGPGIAPENQARVFDAFEQIEPVRGHHAHGIGLGLALVKQIADALGGTVELVSAVGRGSTFTIVLPALAANVEEPGADLATKSA
jgi:signal transduction histidine kinase